ncbi:GPP34 family phosphoprotein [Kitasatospora sp. NPDC049285]|uniref:GPP34 family phosphoprotein n=1 Tax=Kitasatospora sp. NPDC049285 TaxID=3157096 RepID=UPI00343B51C7
MTDPLPYRMYLLAYDDAVLGPFNRGRAGFLVRAAVVTELALRGILTESDGSIHDTGAARCDDPVLDDARERPPAPGCGWRPLLLRDRDRTLRAVEEQLAARGTLAVEDRPALVAPERRVTIVDAGAVLAVREAAAAAVHAPADTPPADAALLTLAALAALPPTPSAPPTRLAALAARLGGLAPSLPEALRSLPEAMNRLPFRAS